MFVPEAMKTDSNIVCRGIAEPWLEFLPSFESRHDSQRSSMLSVRRGGVSLKQDFSHLLLPSDNGMST
jgi:hypothetical protein